MDLFQRLKRMTTLLVDPDGWVRDSMRLLFQQEGCKLTAVETAEEGLKALQCASYDLVIADHGLPDMDGLEFLKRISRSHPRAVRLLTTTGRSETVEKEAAHFGMSNVIQKPFSKNAIAIGLSRVLPVMDGQAASSKGEYKGGEQALYEDE